MNRNYSSHNHFDLLWSIIFHDSDHESYILFLNRLNCRKVPKITITTEEMRILKYLTLFFKTIKSESECGELRTAIPGLDIPRKWPWLTDGPNGIEILLDNGDKLVLLDGNIELGRNRYHHPIEFNSKLYIYYGILTASFCFL